MSPRPTPDEIEARITGPDGWFFPWHASYRVGIGLVESGSLAWTRRGIERKARRVMRRLERQAQASTNATTMTGGRGRLENDQHPDSPRQRQSEAKR